jgi:isopenicillin N synthase-like dioxygenase
LGGTKHTDNDFITVLLQDHIGGLQVLYENTWVDVSPVPGALVINIGDLLQVNVIGRTQDYQTHSLRNRKVNINKKA